MENHFLFACVVDNAARLRYCAPISDADHELILNAAPEGFDGAAPEDFDIVSGPSAPDALALFPDYKDAPMNHFPPALRYPPPGWRMSRPPQWAGGLSETTLSYHTPNLQILCRVAGDDFGESALVMVSAHYDDGARADRVARGAASGRPLDLGALLRDTLRRAEVDPDGVPPIPE
jgi:hypothetical protein